jgi:hypothetical protein
LVRGIDSLGGQLQRAALSIPANIAIEVRRMLTGLVKHVRQADR